jgi:CRISPR/Cas system CMR subunit Cmr6 (Cas7 group RAMP superfamily)
MAIENLKRHLILVRLIFKIILWLKIKADLNVGSKRHQSKEPPNTANKKPDVNYIPPSKLKEIIKTYYKS